MDLRFYLSLFLRRLPWFLLVTVTVSAVAIAVARTLPTVYIAKATLVVESEQIPDSLAASTVQTQAVEQMQIIQQRILSRDTLVDMANRLQIYEPAPGVAAKPMDADALVQDLRKRIQIITTGGAENRRGPTQATLVSVSFEAPTADLAASVANDVVTLILKTDVEMRTGAARQTLDFFSQGVARLEKDIAERSDKMLKFKQANSDALPEGLTFSRNQLTTARAQLAEQSRVESDLQTRRDQMVRLHKAAQSSNATDGGQVAGQAATPEQQQLRGLKDQLTAQQAVLSPENPKIKLLIAQIAALEKVVSGQTASGQVDAAGNELSGYDVQLADLDAQLASAKQDKQATQVEIDKLLTAISATPGNAIILEALQRDYDNIKSQYELAVNNKARAETGDTIETMSKGQRISVIEQAVAPTDPARPNRRQIALAGVGGALGLGLGLVMLIEFFHAGIRRPAELTAKLGIMVFATLPYIRTRREVVRRRLVVLLIFVGILAGIAAMLWAINTYYAPLDLLIGPLLQRFSQLAEQMAVLV